MFSMRERLANLLPTSADRCSSLDKATKEKVFPCLCIRVTRFFLALLFSSKATVCVVW